MRVTWPSGDVRLWPSAPGTARYPAEFADIRDVGPVHGILAGPPCTKFSTAGSRVPRTDEEMIEALSVVDACIRLVWVLKPKWWALENPVSKLPKWLGNPVYKFQPFEYGDPYRKETWLWGVFNPPTAFMNPVAPHGTITDFHRSANIRAITPRGFANAFFKANP